MMETIVPHSNPLAFQVEPGSPETAALRCAGREVIDRAWVSGLEGEMLWDEPLARHTTFRVGGPVSCLVRPHTEAGLAKLLTALRARGLPVLILGGGSNLLAPDAPWEGIAVQLTRSSTALLRCEGDRDGKIRVQGGAGVRLARLLQFCLQNGLGGLEGLAGIPGTLGGALVMNAGTREGSIADSLIWIDLLDPEGRRVRIPRSDLPARYRCMGLPEGSVVLGACFELYPAAPQVLKRRALESMRRRKQSQPIGWPSAGCVFKNPPGFSAGALIEQCGLKGMRRGDAEVSTRHANWILNRGNARSADILALMAELEERVFARFGIRLEREVRVLRSEDCAEFKP